MEQSESSEGKVMKQFKICAMTDAGTVRQNNEDNFYCNGRYKEDTEKRTDFYVETFTESTMTLAAVFDGMGGGQNGEEAALLAPRELKRYQNEVLSKYPDFDEEEVISRMNACICQRARELSKNMGSTVVLLKLEKGKAQVINVGDSRGYLCRGKNLTCLSTDHTEENRFLELQKELGMEMGETKQEWKHILTQYLGIEEEEFILEPAVSEDIPVEEEDMFLLCSDGLTGMVSEEEMVRIMSQRVLPEEKAENLKKAALAAGGKDNVTIVLIQI